MEIISISRLSGGVGIPDTFVLGQTPIENDDIKEGPVVSKIKYFGMSTVYDKIHRGPVYIVEFEDSTVKRIIPANQVVDVAVETAIKVKEELPALPQ